MADDAMDNSMRLHTPDTTHDTENQDEESSRRKVKKLKRDHEPGSHASEGTVPRSNLETNSNTESHNEERPSGRFYPMACTVSRWFGGSSTKTPENSVTKESAEREGLTTDNEGLPNELAAARAQIEDLKRQQSQDAQKLKDDNGKLQRQIEQLKRQQQQDTKNLKDQIERLQYNLYGAESEIGRLERLRQRDGTRTRSLEDRNEKLQNTLFELQSQSDDLQQHHDSLTGRYQKLQVAISDKDITAAHQQSDSEISSAVNQVFQQIKALVQRIYKAENVASIDHLREQQLASGLLLRVAPRLKHLDEVPQYLCDKRVRRFFLRGLLGLIVSEGIFRTLPATGSNDFTGFDNWMGKDVKTAVDTLERNLLEQGSKVDTKSFHEWRAFTMTLLGRVHEDSTNYILELAIQTMTLLGPWMDPSKHDKMRESLISIFASALSVSALLRKQRACWSLCLPQIKTMTSDNRILLDQETMKDINSPDDDEDELGQEKENRSGRAVDIFVTTALCKQGNNDGEKYDQGLYIVEKAEAFCSDVPTENAARESAVLQSVEAEPLSHM